MSDPIFDDIKCSPEKEHLRTNPNFAAGYWYQGCKYAERKNKELVELCKELFNIIENKEEASCVEIRHLKDKIESYKI